METMWRTLFLALYVTGFLGLMPICTWASEPPRLQYEEGKPVLDSDLDGITDVGEQQLFGTNPLHPDTDNDGWLDGTEVLSQTDPNDASVPLNSILREALPAEGAAPYPWYIGRIGGLVAFGLLYVVMFLGLAIRLPVLKRLIHPVYSLAVHHWLSLQALFFAVLHALVFLLDDFMKISVPDLFVPFLYSGGFVSSLFLGFGILALYGLVILVVTSVWKRFLPYRLWRLIHFLNIFVYGAVVVHAVMLGTDLKGTFARDVFVILNEILAALIVWNMVLKMKSVWSRRMVRATPAAGGDGLLP